MQTKTLIILTTKTQSNNPIISTGKARLAIHKEGKKPYLAWAQKYPKRYGLQKWVDTFSSLPNSLSKLVLPRIYLNLALSALDGIISNTDERPRLLDYKT
ncbi:Uncharacterized protein TCM_040535 [Theobroma cacao]|uniref:Uncharacterized protein n=1 Tax=Theobroma cacao TaxID=3641 RepID=A0A061GT09_THECC|nr:Uncharacterized protein TCM_040535 [Theobroma cacao]